MPYAFYKVLHLGAIFLLFTSLGSAAVLGSTGAPRGDGFRKWVSMLHGISLALILIAGFGLLARLGLAQGGMPGWAIGKVVLWLVMGGATALCYRQGKLARTWIWLLPIVGMIGAALAVYKP